MNILLVDNSTDNLDRLKALLPSHKITTIKFSELNSFKSKDFDLIILSGSKHFSVIGNELLYQNEINLIKSTKLPVIGICLGFELISYAYGARLYRLANKIQGISDLQIIKNSPIFSGLVNFKIYDSHRWLVKELPRDLIELARSKHGLEIVKHRSRPIYGLQFHPERFIEETAGSKIFNNLLAILTKNY